MSTNTPPLPGPHQPAQERPLPSEAQLLEPLELLDDAGLGEHPAHFERLLGQLTEALEEEA
ncbi:hypothetical protein [Galactobacter caseinivorans]|uniref:Uncharacterized protein n=1 Tax=Galactobacter caseinivorans TaxID=2676123 RepID=A0A496PK79_9MICC|nr:hypothetical protein [Galactobacter caseinivorans]RKW70923.1 hypothetical protein DWQ67_03680 [Galactobacter caseinivorans]